MFKQKQVHNAVKRSIYTLALLAHMISGIVEPIWCVQGVFDPHLFD